MPTCFHNTFRKEPAASDVMALVALMSRRFTVDPRSRTLDSLLLILRNWKVNTGSRFVSNVTCYRQYPLSCRFDLAEVLIHFDQESCYRTIW